MVPTLTPADETAPPVPRASPGSFRPPYPAPGFGPLPPQQLSAQEHAQPPPMYGSLPPSRYPPPPPHLQQQHGAWGPPYPGGNGGPPPPGHFRDVAPDQRAHQLPPQPPMEHRDRRNTR